ncbi:MAG: arylsulfatase [Planctomycetes bacterium]|nr:arylsulfatase [Planctomycetota bacterium]
MASVADQQEDNPQKPNVVLIVMDDMGFSDPGCYGGEVETPNLNGLAEQGLRFTQFYNTGRCWPSRSCMMTGFYAQQICMDPPDGKTHYRPSWQRLLPHYLRQVGYRSYHSGKWHISNVQKPEEFGEFDISWGTQIEQGKHFFGEEGEKKFSSTAITDHALECLRDHETNHRGSPFFQYVCYTAPHFPVQAEPEDIDKYRRRYDEGWDIMRERRWQRLREMGIVNCPLSEREPDLKAPWYKEEYGERYGPGEIEYAVPWDSLTDEQKEFQATKMAIHAGMVDRTDREIGRLLDQLREMNVYDDTLVLFLSDNGASAEIMIRAGGHDPMAPPGSETTHLCLGPGWSNCSNSPFRRHKIWVHEGGVATPMIASWPNGIAARGELRHDMGHCIDFLPTILELAGIRPGDIPFPADAPPLPGRSLAPTFGEDDSIEHSHIFFHHSGNRALRIGNWKIVSASDSGPVGSMDDDWALYDLSTDRSEMNDLSKEKPDRCREMQGFWRECEETYRQDAGKLPG